MAKRLVSVDLIIIKDSRADFRSIGSIGVHGLTSVPYGNMFRYPFWAAHKGSSRETKAGLRGFLHLSG